MDLSPPDWEYVEERAGSFVGREWVFAQVRSFLSGPPGTFLLRGDPGTGKTAVAARLAQASFGRAAADTFPAQPPVAAGTISAAVFCRAGKTTVPELAERLSRQLEHSVAGFSDAVRATLAPEIRVRDVRIEARDVEGDVTGVRIVLDGLSDERAFRARLTAPLRKLRELAGPPQIVLLVDAVDEAATAGEVNTFSRLLGELDGVYLIVTCRADARVLVDFRDAEHKVDLIADTPPGEDDVRDYIRNRLRGQGLEGVIAALADRIATEASGNFLYAFYVTGAFVGSGSLAGIDEKAARSLPLPTGGLAGVYEDFLDRHIAGDENRWESEFRPVLAPVSVALGDGFTTAQLAAIASRLTGRNFSLQKARDVTRLAAPFLDGPRPDGPFRAYHQSFARFLTDPDQNPNWPIDPTETNNAVARALTDSVPDGEVGAKDWAAASTYVRRHLATHAVAAGILDEFLLDPAYLLAADPLGLVRQLGAARSREARAAAKAYRMAVHHFIPQFPEADPSHLELAAYYTGSQAIIEGLARYPGPRPWSVAWAHVNLTSGQVVLGRGARGVVHIACTTALDGTPLALTGLALTGYFGRLPRIWDLSTLQLSGELPIKHQSDSIGALACTKLADGTPAAIIATQHETLLWNLANLEPIGELGNKPRIRSIACGALRDGTPVAVISEEPPRHSGVWSLNRVWNLLTLEPLYELAEEGLVIHAVCARLSDGTSIAITTDIPTTQLRYALRLWDLDSGRLRGSVEPSNGGVAALDCVTLPGGTVVLVHVALNGAVETWHLLPDGPVRKKAFHLPVTRLRGSPSGSAPRAHWESVRAASCARMPDGTPLLAVIEEYSRFLSVWDLTTGKPYSPPVDTRIHWPRALACSSLPTGRPVAITSGRDGTVRIWDLQEIRDAVREIRNADRFGEFTRVAYTGGPAGSRLVVTITDEVPHIWDAATGQLRAKLPLRHVPLSLSIDMAFECATLPDGTPVCIITDDGASLACWNLSTQRRRGRRLEADDLASASTLTILSVDDGPVAVTCDHSEVLQLWDLRAGKRRDDPLLCPAAVGAIDSAVLPDGTPLVMALDNKGDIRVWDLRSRQQVFETIHAPRDIVELACSAQRDGTLIIAAITHTDRGYRLLFCNAATPIDWQLGETDIRRVACTQLVNRTALIVAANSGGCLYVFKGLPSEAGSASGRRPSRPGNRKGHQAGKVCEVTELIALENGVSDLVVTETSQIFVTTDRGVIAIQLAGGNVVS